MSGEIAGRSADVFSCGQIGIFGLQAVTVLGATKVFAVEVAPARFKLASQCAPDAVFINPA